MPTGFHIPSPTNFDVLALLIPADENKSVQQVTLHVNSINCGTLASLATYLHTADITVSNTKLGQTAPSESNWMKIAPRFYYSSAGDTSDAKINESASAQSSPLPQYNSRASWAGSLVCHGDALFANLFPPTSVTLEDWRSLVIQSNPALLMSQGSLIRWMPREYHAQSWRIDYPHPFSLLSGLVSQRIGSGGLTRSTVYHQHDQMKSNAEHEVKYQS